MPEEIITENDPIDVSQEEMDGALAAAGAMTTMYWRAQLDAIDQQYQEAPEEQKPAVAQKKAEVVRAAQQSITQVPVELKRWQDTLVKTAKETGVPVSVLADARNKSEMDSTITRYLLTHPKPASPQAASTKAATPVVEPEDDPPARQRQIDSGVNVGTGAEDWRNLSPMDKIKYGLK